MMSLFSKRKILMVIAGFFGAVLGIIGLFVIILLINWFIIAIYIPYSNPSVIEVSNFIFNPAKIFSQPKTITDQHDIQQLIAIINFLEVDQQTCFGGLENLNDMFELKIYSHGKLFIDAVPSYGGCDQISFTVINGKSTDQLRRSNKAFWLLIEKLGIGKRPNDWDSLD